MTTETLYIALGNSYNNAAGQKVYLYEEPVTFEEIEKDLKAHYSSVDWNSARTYARCVGLRVPNGDDVDNLIEIRVATPEDFPTAK